MIKMRARLAGTIGAIVKVVTGNTLRMATIDPLSPVSLHTLHMQ